MMGEIIAIENPRDKTQGVLAQAECHTANHWSIDGDLTYDTVPHLWQNIAREYLTKAGKDEVWQLDLKNVQQVDSAALAFLLEWLKQARRCRSHLTLLHYPPTLLAIAEICDVDILLFPDRDQST